MSRKKKKKTKNEKAMENEAKYCQMNGGVSLKNG